MKVTLKVATSLDARIATASGESQWITCEAARAAVHDLRRQHDAVLVGSGTLLADDPRLTVRGLEVQKQPDRVVLDSKLVTTPAARVFEAETGRVIIFTRTDPQYGSGVAALRSRGALVEAVSHERSGLNLKDVVSRLSALGISSVFIEGGGLVAASFLMAGLIDRIEWFRAPIILGGDGRAVFGPVGVNNLSAAFRFVRTGVRNVGSDLWETYERGE